VQGTALNPLRPFWHPFRPTGVGLLSVRWTPCDRPGEHTVRVRYVAFGDGYRDVWAGGGFMQVSMSDPSTT